MEFTTTAFDFTPEISMWYWIIAFAIALAMTIASISTRNEHPLFLIIFFVFGLAGIILIAIWSTGGDTDAELLKKDIGKVGIENVQFVNPYDSFTGNRDGSFVKCTLFPLEDDDSFEVLCDD